MAKAKVKAPVNPPLTIAVPVALDSSFNNFTSVAMINKFGNQLVIPCQDPEHAAARIPGLDAEGCSQCRIWWFDARYSITDKEAKETGRQRLGKRKAA